MFSWGHLYLSYNNPAIEPLGEAVPNTELFRRLAKAMGIDGSVLFRTDDEMIEASLDWTNPVLQGITLRGRQGEGLCAAHHAARPDDWAPHRDGNFPTPTGKCEFKSTITGGGNFVVPLFRQGYNGDQDGTPVDPLPHYIPPNENPQTAPALAKRYPLSLISPKSHAFLNSNYGNLPAQTAQAGEEQAVFLHPDDAEQRGIVAGAPIRVFNDRGRLRPSPPFARRHAGSGHGAVGILASLQPQGSNGPRADAPRVCRPRPSTDLLGRPRSGRQALNATPLTTGRNASPVVSFH